MNDLHHWDVLSISCIDGRFNKKLADWLAQKNNNVYDLVTAAGASKAIIESGATQEHIFDTISLSQRLHEIKEVWIIDHVDCGAYDGSKRFDNDYDEELAFHKQKLAEAKMILEKNFPNLVIRTFFMNWDEIISA